MSSELLDKLIKTHIERMWGGLEMASVEHFMQTGRVSGGFYTALTRLALGFAEYKKDALPLPKDVSITATAAVIDGVTYKIGDMVYCWGCKEPWLIIEVTSETPDEMPRFLVRYSADSRQYWCDWYHMKKVE